MFFKVLNVFHIFQNLGSSFSKMLVSRVDFKRCKNHKMLVSMVFQVFHVFHIFHGFHGFPKCWFQVLISKDVKFTKCSFQGIIHQNVFHVSQAFHVFQFSKMLVSRVFQAFQVFKFQYFVFLFFGPSSTRQVWRFKF